MRLFSSLLFALAFVLAALALFLYVYLQGLGCAYVLRPGACRIRLPWELGHEDFFYLVAIPWGVVLAVTAIAALLRRPVR